MVITVFVENGMNEPEPVRTPKYRFEFKRDKIGRLERKNAFAVSGSSAPYTYTPIIETDYEYYKHPNGDPKNGETELYKPTIAREMPEPNKGWRR